MIPETVKQLIIGIFSHEEQAQRRQAVKVLLDALAEYNYIPPPEKIGKPSVVKQDDYQGFAKITFSGNYDIKGEVYIKWIKGYGKDAKTGYKLKIYYDTEWFSDKDT